MVKRNYSWMNIRMLALLFFSLTILLLSWETNRANAAFAGTGIPDESIRIRIIANSDTIADQAMKRIIRDRVEKVLERTVPEPEDLTAAREAIRGQLPVLRELVGTLLAERGFRYGYEVELEQTEFPEKMYGARLYSSGSYEALRITLGKGDGKNWWCVLFPPLCFADAVTAETASAAGTDGGKAGKADKGEVKTEIKAEGKQAKLSAAAGIEAAGGEAENGGGNEKPEVRSFFWDKLQQLGSWIKGLF